ncbi:hypothetical protein [Alicyclobacillus acidocaldarius]|uniref:Uncharacterized protein n=1 Tax=Alicyclobacillus acidocaldarius subsp. acidocaldarius (strain ATCC 27009 / DSM 446 / BCRC 14685 / JCM 5260 / KCTC 1825 / NBRC 15652 / NCIMB 11725 / NRRL B-14509 / 104-IA) TaxID=521098 RepID=C8WVK4_ALIAD|nr:hypothetical protein [Alicyclobacillus acidocaldarius]ACV58126.1 hypothetical protein Aaci_1090 [Alicyclobacillus acidocaldarius subsp. acidocaldarius DSM 446]MCL6489911.1 hypothetical protein [Alicyclobacillus mali (ex Roth et al. 2021)]
MRLSIQEAEVQVVLDGEEIRVLLSDAHGPLELLIDQGTARKLRDCLDLVLRSDDGPRGGGPLVVS